MQYSGQNNPINMSDTIENKILKKIRKAKRGTLFFSDNFSMFGNAETIRRTLNRLVEAGEIDRVSSGIFVRPQMDKIIGKITPKIEDIADAIARRDKAKIVPTGAYALNRLGLSTQVPMKPELNPQSYHYLLHCLYF